MSQRKNKYRDALYDLVEAVIAVEAYGDIEGGCEGNGPLVQAIKVLQYPMPETLIEWLREDDPDDDCNGA